MLAHNTVIVVVRPDLHIFPDHKYDNVPFLCFPSDIISGGFEYQVHQNHTVFFYHEDSEEMYVGGTDFVLQLDVDDYHIIEVGVSGLMYFEPLFLIFLFCLFYRLR